MQATAAAVSLKNTHEELLASHCQLQQQRDLLQRRLRKFCSFSNKKHGDTSQHNNDLEVGVYAVSIDQC